MTSTVLWGKETEALFMIYTEELKNWISLVKYSGRQIFMGEIVLNRDF